MPDDTDLTSYIRPKRRERTLELSVRLAAADRLARKVLDFTHGEDCRGNLVDSYEICYECHAEPPEPCSCTCGTCEIWRLAQIIRPQGVRDPQPTTKEALKP